LVTFSNEIFKYGNDRYKYNAKNYTNGESTTGNDDGDDQDESMDVNGDGFVVLASNTTINNSKESWTILP